MRYNIFLVSFPDLYLSPLFTIFFLPFPNSFPLPPFPSLKIWKFWNNEKKNKTMVLHSNIGIILCRKHSLRLGVKFISKFSHHSCVCRAHPCHETFNKINIIISMLWGIREVIHWKHKAQCLAQGRCSRNVNSLPPFSFVCILNCWRNYFLLIFYKDNEQ